MYLCGVTALVAFDTNTLVEVRLLQHLRLTHFQREGIGGILEEKNLTLVARYIALAAFVTNTLVSGRHFGI